MAGFRVDEAAVTVEQKRVQDLGTDAARARFYATTNIQLTGDQGVLGHIRPSVDQVRAGIESALDAAKRYLDGSSDGLAAAVRLYQRTDRERAAATDSTSPAAGPRPRWAGTDDVTDTQPGPDSDDARAEWGDYQSEHKVDTGPGNPTSWRRPDDPPPSMGPAPSAPPASGPTPSPAPGPRPTPPR